jgi:DNA-binding MarR family transcriptional regulator
MIKKEKRHTRYFKDIVYKGQDTLIYAERKPAEMKILLDILKKQPLKRRDLIKMTNWTKDQIAGLLSRGQKNNLIELNNGIISLR